MSAALYPVCGRILINGTARCGAAFGMAVLVRISTRQSVERRRFMICWQWIQLGPPGEGGLLRRRKFVEGGGVELILGSLRRWKDALILRVILCASWFMRPIVLFLLFYGRADVTRLNYWQMCYTYRGHWPVLKWPSQWVTTLRPRDGDCFEWCSSALIT